MYFTNTNIILYIGLLIFIRVNNRHDLNDEGDRFYIIKSGTVSGLTMSSEVYKWIYNNCIDWLNDNNISINEGNHKQIEWIIYVPSIWTNKSKKLMIKWCKLGGLSSIRIVYASDCASLALLYELNKTRKHLYYELNKTNISCHEIYNKFSVKEIMHEMV